MSGPFIQRDEELRADMSPTERNRVLELRRIHQGEEYKLKVTLVKSKNHAWEGDHFVCTFDCIHVEIHQRPRTANTSSRIIRKLSTIDAQFENPRQALLQRLDRANPTAIAQARTRAKETLAEMNLSHLKFSKFEFQSLKHKIPYDDKGLAATAIKCVEIINDEDGDREPHLETTELLEVFSTRRQDVDPEIIDGIGRSEREKAIRLAREEIQGRSNLRS